MTLGLSEQNLSSRREPNLHKRHPALDPTDPEKPTATDPRDPRFQHQANHKTQITKKVSQTNNNRNILSSKRNPTELKIPQGNSNK